MEFIEQQRLNFLKFVDDCAVYCIEKSGLVYQPLQILGRYERFFIASYGDAVLQYHGAHDEMYQQSIRKIPHSIFFTHQGMLEYMNEGVRKCFTGGSTIMEGILMFCCLYVDTAIYCFRFGHGAFINTTLIYTVNAVFEDHVKRLFISVERALVSQLWNDIMQKGMDLIEREKAATVPQK
ncbi:hypothetical protein HNY73_008623 [Argiope bruennichi]|uniref:Uncharacterized protein n=1 Tax=Argiope bruennichi TaxID=94029 RepID=A0A8T0F805_ARGBR|nr:hypothetical protein HNY73_008623 [Argiope bruennichi]